MHAHCYTTTTPHLDRAAWICLRIAYFLPDRVADWIKSKM